MSEKIKKQIKRSMPWFMIFNLIISTAVVGLVFNFDFGSIAKLKDLKFKVDMPAAQADTATTTVRVRNAPPAITGEAAESPASTAWTPVNINGSISFTITANDSEDNDYYLIVCSSNSVIASTTGGPPACGGGGTQFCVSGLTVDNTQANCTYANLVDPVPTSETQAWYAFACDNHPTEGECSSPGDDGSGDSGSPFYINHAPDFTAVVTWDNYKDPGGTFTIRASTTDSDVARGAEVLHLYACQTNSWATSTGCTAPLCHATSTSPNVDCSFATGTVAVDGDYTYYAFVMDDFFLPAPQNSRSATYHVNNVSPVISNVKINGDAHIELRPKNSVDGDFIATTSSVAVSDANSCLDIQGATGTIYWSGAAGGNNCSSNPNSCYQISVSNCWAVPGTCEGPSDAFATYICSTTIAFYAIPTDASPGNPNSGTNWLAAITVFDEEFATTSISVSGVDVMTNIALEVTEADIPYGIIQAGQDSGTNTATTTVVNFGNSPLNTYLYGQDMTGPASISITEQEHSLVAYFNYGAGTSATSTLPGNLENTDIARPTSQTDVFDHIYWGINIPGGTPSGEYEGLNTFTVALDAGGW